MFLKEYVVGNYKTITFTGIGFTTPHNTETEYVSCGLYGPNSAGKTIILEALHSVSENLNGVLVTYTPHVNGETVKHYVTVETKGHSWEYAYNIGETGITYESLSRHTKPENIEDLGDFETIYVHTPTEPTHKLAGHQYLQDKTLPEDAHQVLKYIATMFWATPGNSYLSPKLMEAGYTRETLTTSILETIGVPNDSVSEAHQEWVNTMIGVMSALTDGKLVIMDDFGNNVHPETATTFLASLQACSTPETPYHIVYATQNTAIMAHLMTLPHAGQKHHITLVEYTPDGTDTVSLNTMLGEDYNPGEVFTQYVEGHYGGIPETYMAGYGSILTTDT